MNARELPRRDYEALKERTKELTKRFATLDEASRITCGRTDPARLSRFGNPHEHGMFAPIDIIADLEAHIGEPVVTALLADMLGYVLVPKKAAKGSSDIVQLLGNVAKESGEAIACLATLAIPDAQTPEAIQRALREIGEAQAVTAGAEKVLSEIEDRLVPRRS